MEPSVPEIKSDTAQPSIKSENEPDIKQLTLKFENESEIEQQMVETENESEIEQQMVEAEKEFEIGQQMVETENESEIKQQMVETENESEIKQQMVETENESEIKKQMVETENESEIKQQMVETENESEIEQQMVEAENEGSDDNEAIPRVNITVDVEEYMPWLTEHSSSDWEIQSNHIKDDERPMTVITPGVVLKQPLLCKCSACNKNFGNSYSLLQHNLTHLQICLHKCDGPQQIKKDKNINPTKIMHKCDICQKMLSYKTWHTHMREVHSAYIFPCNICNKIFTCERYYDRHKKFVHGGVNRNTTSKKKPGQFKCEKCDAVFRHISPLSTHMRNVHSETVTCTICDSKLKSSYLLAHMRRVHYDDGKHHVCSICNKKFKSPRYVKIHIRNAHPRNGVRIVACAKSVVPNGIKCKCGCNKRFVSEHELFDHIGNDQRKININHACRVCKKRFASEYSVTRHHNKFHKGKPNYSCDVCGEGFNDYFDLEKHKVVFHSEIDVPKRNRVGIKIEYADDHLDLVKEEYPLDYNAYDVAVREIKLEDM